MCPWMGFCLFVLFLCNSLVNLVHDLVHCGAFMFCRGYSPWVCFPPFSLLHLVSYLVHYVPSYYALLLFMNCIMGGVMRTVVC